MNNGGMNTDVFVVQEESFTVPLCNVFTETRTWCCNAKKIALKGLHLNEWGIFDSR